MPRWPISRVLLLEILADHITDSFVTKLVWERLAYKANGLSDGIWLAGGNGTLLVSQDGGESWKADPVGDVQPSNFIRILFEGSDTKGIKGFVLGERGTLLRWAA